MPACILRTIRPSIKKHGLDNGASRINYKESRVRCRQRLLKLYALYFSNLSNSQWMGAHLACSFHLCRLRSTYLNRNFCANAAHQPKRLLACCLNWNRFDPSKFELFSSRCCAAILHKIPVISLGRTGGI